MRFFVAVAGPMVAMIFVFFFSITQFLGVSFIYVCFSSSGMDVDALKAKGEDLLRQIKALPQYVLYGSCLIAVGVVLIIIGLFLL